MNKKKSGAVEAAPLIQEELQGEQEAVVEPIPFDPKNLSKEQQESVVEEYLGFHPKYFLYDGLQVKLNLSRFEAENRAEAKRTGEPRKWFNGWNPKKR